jgi:polysaccharide pyruvyl transferase WcaK-like protein
VPVSHRKLLIAGAYGSGNLGDEAILAGLMKLIVDGKNYDRSRVVVFSRDPKETSHLHNVIARRKNLLDLLRTNDVLIGGGELFQDIGYMAVKYSILGLINKIVGKRVKFYAVGVSSNRSRVAKLLMTISLSVADEISVRDSASRERLRSLGIRKPVMVVPDPACYVEPVSTEEATHLLSREGIEVHETRISVAIVSQYIRDPQQNRRVQLLLSNFIKRSLKKHHNVQFVFFPFNCHKDVSSDKDIICGKWLESVLKSGRYKIVHSACTPQQVMGMLRLMDLVVSTRFHPLLFAVRTGVPAIGIDLFEKVGSFCRKYGLPLVGPDEHDKIFRLMDTLTCSARAQEQSP